MTRRNRPAYLLIPGDRVRIGEIVHEVTGVQTHGQHVTVWTTGTVHHVSHGHRFPLAD